MWQMWTPATAGLARGSRGSGRVPSALMATFALALASMSLSLGVGTAPV